MQSNRAALVAEPRPRGHFWCYLALAGALAAAVFLAACVVQCRTTIDYSVLQKDAGGRPAYVPDTVLVAPPETHARLYRLADRFWRQVLAPAGCADAAWLTSGSLLGWVRHSGRAIPWDDDVDVACREQDAARIVAAARAAGWSVRRFVCFYKFMPPETAQRADWLSTRMGTAGDELDLFPMRPQRSDREGEGGALWWENPCPQFARERYRDADLWPLRNVAFGDAPSVRVPANPVPFLAAAYGETWASRAKAGVAAYHARHPAMGRAPPRLWAALAFVNPLLADVGFAVPPASATETGTETKKAGGIRPEEAAADWELVERVR